jgi:MFS family permease
MALNKIMSNKITKQTILSLPRNIWAVSLTSFFMDISSEMVLNLIPLFLSNVLGVKTSLIGLIEGIAESTASILKLFSGWLSDKLRARKWLAVVGYSLSALSKPFFYFANSWGSIAAVRWVDRIGKGIRTAPRDALVADSISEKQRGLAFGFHRAADTGGAMLGLIIALLVIWLAQSAAIELGVKTFQLVVLVSLLPAFLAVLSLIVGVRDVPVKSRHAVPKFGFKSLGHDFLIFMIIVSIFALGNSSDAFLTLRAQGLGLNVVGIMGMLITFNLVYTLVSAPAGSLSDRIGRKRLITAGWLAYAIVYYGFAFAQAAWQVWLFYAAYGLFYGMAYGTINAMLADIVPPELRGTAYGTYNAVIGLLAFPASLFAGVLWQGIGDWPGMGPSAPFFLEATLALISAILMFLWKPNLASK